MGIAWFFRSLGLAIEWLGYFIWDLIHRVFELVFWVWGFSIVTVLIATLAFLFMSLGIKALDETSYSQNILQEFFPDIVSQQRTQSLPAILSDFSDTQQ